MDNILIGTSGFSYTDWLGPLYPPGTPKHEFLSLYGAEFPFVELNFSYYRQPDPGTMERMVRQTPDGFTFTIKAHQSLTHEQSADFTESARTFKEGISPLRDAAKLAAVLFQFPYSFHYNPDSRRYLKRICTEFKGLPLAVEFRNNKWQKESVYRGLSELGVAFVCVDQPALPGLLQPEAVVTGDLAYVRFHGRNRQNWWQGDNTSRYDYLYNKEELSSWIERIRYLAARVRLLLVAFNNHSRGQAVQNARELKDLVVSTI